jgi:DNA-binding MarR family transcriptional regulator
MTAIRSDELPQGLDDQLCLALYTASRAMTAAYRPVLDDLGLTYPQYLVLMLLWEQGTSSVGEIGARLRLESNTLSPLIKRLEALALVTRQRRAGDERTVDVQLTRQGKAMRRRAAGVPAHIGAATELDAPSRARLIKKLRRLTVDLEKKQA